MKIKRYMAASVTIETSYVMYIFFVAIMLMFAFIYRSYARTVTNITAHLAGLELAEIKSKVNEKYFYNGIFKDGNEEIYDIEKKYNFYLNEDSIYNSASLDINIKGNRIETGLKALKNSNNISFKIIKPEEFVRVIAVGEDILKKYESRKNDDK